MPTRRIEKSQWQPYFDAVSRELPAAHVDVEIDTPELGAQPEMSHIRLDGLSYDPRDDAFSIVTEKIEHRIAAPRQISVREDETSLTAVEVIDADEKKHVARLTEALKLPEE